MAESAPATSPPASEVDQHARKRYEGRGRWWRSGKGWLTILAVVAVVGGGIWIYDSVKYRFIAKQFGAVIPGEIYRSGQISRWMFIPTVKEYGIDTVIDLNGIAKNDLNQQAEIAAYETLDLNHYRYQLKGNATGDVDTYIDAIARLATAHRAGQTVLIHCHAGAQRTGSVIAAYRLLVLDVPPEKICAPLMEYGWEPAEDKALLRYLNAHLHEVAAALVDRGILEETPQPIPVVRPPE